MKWIFHVCTHFCAIQLIFLFIWMGKNIKCVQPQCILYSVILFEVLTQTRSIWNRKIYSALDAENADFHLNKRNWISNANFHFFQMSSYVIIADVNMADDKFKPECSTTSFIIKNIFIYSYHRIFNMNQLWSGWW